MTLFNCQEQKSNSQGEDFSKNVDQVADAIIDESDKLTFFNNPKKTMQSKFQSFSSGSVTPKGWISELMKNDLDKGIVGALDELYPGIKSDDLYNSARRGGMEDIPEMGDLVLTGAAWETSIMWWNAETIGNWWDGFIRHAFLTKDEDAIAQSKAIVENLLDSQDEDGYIGIYKNNLRYQHEGSNGELWAQTTAFRAMLAYYEFTKQERVLKAVERAMAVTMKHYNEDVKNPFDLKNAFGGVTHGLMMTDVCETLYRITGNTIYQDYATYLYKAFSTFSINRSFNDLRYPFLIEKDSAFEGHAVHTYEHFRSLVNAYYHTGYDELKVAYENSLQKLEPCILPSGAGHGNEWIAKLDADPTTTSSEYCTMLELRNSYGSILQKSGDIDFADAAEKLTYNGMMGFRNSEGTAITYGKSDNSYVLDGKHHDHDESRKDPRYKYSPTHSEPAVCCAPNYARNYPYFLDQMWMKSSNGIAAVMYGPSQLKTNIDEVNVQIEQKTNYPFSDEVVFEFSLDSPKAFTLYFRKPDWTKAITVSEEAQLNDGYYNITKIWEDGDQIKINFDNPIEAKKFQNGEVYFQRGPLVFAFEIPHEEKAIKTYEDETFKDYYCFPSEDTFQDLKVGENTFTLVDHLSKDAFPWYDD
ncbi:MAG: beta-L-arabinofuranosidase domain-containing protein, partial [Bacteroidota bacterium]